MLACGHLKQQDVPSWETEQPAPALASGSNRKPPKPAVENDVDVKMSELAVESQGSDLGAKCNLSARSPDKAEGPSKRTRLANETPATSKASSQHVYLTGKVYVNGSPVTPAVVPKVQGQVGPRPFTVPVHSNAEIDMQAMPKQQANPGRLCCDMAEGEAPSPVLLF
jgi:hypothetical protein